MFCKVTYSRLTYCAAAISIYLAYASSAAAQKIHNIWDPPYKNGIAAVVEKQIITFEELRREMGPLIPRLQEQYPSPRVFQQQMRDLYLEIMQNLVDRVLVVKEFREELEGQIPRTFVEQEFNERLLTDFGGDRSKFLDYVRSQGKTMREYRKELEEQIIVSVMRGRRRKSQSEISPEKIENFYNQNKIHFFQEESIQLRLIMLKPFAEETPDLLIQTAGKILGELDFGADFAELAKRYSQDARRDRGGDWGWIKRSDLREELSQVAFDLLPGQHSDAIQIGNQVFLLNVEDKRNEGIQSLEDVRDRIEGILAQQIQRQSEIQWKEDLRKDAYIRYF